MQELEKILEEIEQRVDYYREHATLTYVDICAGLREAEGIIHKHINGGWIPVEKHLPEGRTRVICQFDNGDIELLWQDWESDPESLTYWTDFDFMAEKKVIAWRPLPEPYRPEKDKTSDIKLKPCPFCNSAGKFSKDRFGLYAVKCSKCGCMTEFQFDFGEGEDISQKKAADIWNRRTDNETD